VDGLEYCIRHMPDELLEEAEMLTGTIRCREQFGAPDACHALAVEGTDPPKCTQHRANWPLARQGTANRAVEDRLNARLAEIMQGKGSVLIDPPRIGDPLIELLDTAAEVKALKEIMRETAAWLLSTDKLRYTSKVGEQLRAELVLYERAVERYTKLLIEISKLRIEERLAGVQEATAVMLERAIDAALTESGVGLDGITSARKAFRRHLKVVEGELVK
jgi:hypothetical protein